MNSEQTFKRIGFINLLAFLVLGVAAAVMASYARSATGTVGVFFFGFGLIVAATSYLQMHLESREKLERLEFEEMRKGRGGESIFTQDAETFPALRTRQQFDKYFVPIISTVLFLAQGVSAVLLWRWINSEGSNPIRDHATLAMAMFGLFGLVFFLLGKYTTGIVKFERRVLLQPGAGYLILGALIGFLTAISEALVWFELPAVDYYAAKVLAVFMGLIAIEGLITLVLEVYRPRVKGQRTRLLYESRLVGLLSRPTGIITSLAQALDYQFGFKVSETWFYRFLERVLAWLVLIQLALLWISTTLVIVGPHENAVVERFGRPLDRGAILDSGLHFKLPWPFDKVYRYPFEQVQSFNVGFEHGEEDKHQVMLWTEKHHGEEFHMLVASRSAFERRAEAEEDGDHAVPVNLLGVSVPVQYRVIDLEKWIYEHVNSADLLKSVATREVTRYLVSVDANSIMTVGRDEAARQIRQMIQSTADDLDLGVEITFVGLQGVHPAVEVADAYEEVNSAIQDKQTNIIAARTYKISSVLEAEAKAERDVQEAKAYRTKVTSASAATAGQFTNQLSAYQASPSVFMHRAYLETLSRAAADTRKYVLITTNTDDVIIMNLEQKLSRDLLDVPVPGAE
ncbi:MAG: protease modulator HflK [Verrucomicrobia bacterium]|nr:protease modulator HflK [Verrucomicrobiota bacterium]MCF7708734.1 protease modulator HflK [Verrucomicrobiota bacterium]